MSQEDNFDPNLIDDDENSSNPDEEEEDIEENAFPLPNSNLLDPEYGNSGHRLPGGDNNETVSNEVIVADSAASSAAFKGYVHKAKPKQLPESIKCFLKQVLQPGKRLKRALSAAPDPIPSVKGFYAADLDNSVSEQLSERMTDKNPAVKTAAAQTLRNDKILYNSQLNLQRSITPVNKLLDLAHQLASEETTTIIADQMVPLLDDLMQVLGNSMVYMTTQRRLTSQDFQI